MRQGTDDQTHGRPDQARAPDGGEESEPVDTVAQRMQRTIAGLLAVVVLATGSTAGRGGSR